MTSPVRSGVGCAGREEEDAVSWQPPRLSHRHQPRTQCRTHRLLQHPSAKRGARRRTARVLGLRWVLMRSPIPCGFPAAPQPPLKWAFLTLGARVKAALGLGSHQASQQAQQAQRWEIRLWIGWLTPKTEHRAGPSCSNPCLPQLMGQDPPPRHPHAAGGVLWH